MENISTEIRICFKLLVQYFPFQGKFPYHCPICDGVNLDAFWLLLVSWGFFESQVLLSLGWTLPPCHAEVRSSLGHNQGDSRHFLGLLDKIWVSAGSVLGFRCRRRDERSCSLYLKLALVAASLSAALAVILYAGGMDSLAYRWTCSSVADSFCV